MTAGAVMNFDTTGTSARTLEKSMWTSGVIAGMGRGPLLEEEILCRLMPTGMEDDLRRRLTIFPKRLKPC